MDLTRSRAESEAAELQERLVAQGAALDALQAELATARAQAQDIDHVSVWGAEGRRGQQPQQPALFVALVGAAVSCFA